MRVGGMLSEAVASVFLLVFLAVQANARPVQYLPDIPGYIPVYIRYGDQPLEEIHLTLAKAFNEKGTIKNSIQKTPISQLQFETSNKELTIKNDVSSESKEDLSGINLIPPIISGQSINDLPKQEKIFPATLNLPRTNPS